MLGNRVPAKWPSERHHQAARTDLAPILLGSELTGTQSATSPIRDKLFSIDSEQLDEDGLEGGWIVANGSSGSGTSP
jgi:hypothetical protein